MNAPEQPQTAVAVPAPTPIEDETTMRQWFGRIADRVVDASKLAERVKALEDQVAGLRLDLQGAQEALREEQSKHFATREALDSIQRELDKERGTVHDLVMERDIVIEERNAAQAQRDSVGEEANRLRAVLANVTDELVAANTRADHCTERANRMQDQVNALKLAWDGLRSL